MISNHVPNYRNVVVSLVLGIVISSQYCIVSAVPPRSRQDPLEPITLDNYLNGDFRHRDFAGQWEQGSDNLLRIFKPDSIVNYDVQSGNETVLVYIKDINDQLPANSTFTNIIFSNDGNFALIEHGRSSVWRYSALAKYDIFDINTKKLTSKLAPPENSDDDERTLQYVKWSPTGNGIAFVYNWNIYYRANANPDTVVRKLTTDGDEENAIYNGISDWVYEEEMFGGPNALWISKSGSNLAFVKFDDSKVEEFQWPMYGEPGSNESIYPKYRKIRYPKTGTPNPNADVYIISLTDPNSQPVKVTYEETSEADRHIIGTALWASESELMVATLNRAQTVSKWHLCSQNTAVCRQIYTYSLTHGWVDMNTPKVSEDGTKFVFVQSVKHESEPEAYKHIVMFMADKTSKVLTSGRLSIENILGWDETNHKIFFSGTFWNGTHADPSESHVYSVSDDGVNTTPSCITCGLKNSFDDVCKENSVMFSGQFTRFIHRCSGPEVPETTTRFTADGRTVENPGPTYINNTNVREALSKKAVPMKREYTVNVGDKFTARARLFLPVDFDESKKYPLLISVYGGPGSQNIQQQFGITWETSLVSDKQIIFGHIDGRGTAGSSTDHLFTLHRKLGTAEIEDQVTVAKHLVETLPFIDANKTSIWGWSYGGYATAKVLEIDTENVFKCGISVAPVTSWRYYDTIYTERYMGLPTEDDNLKAYEDSDVTSKQAIENLRNKQYMLVHGNADDNVHYQQSMILARAMEQGDIFFHQLSYPDENHGISGPGMRRHLYHSLQRFLFDECYKIAANPEERISTTTNNGGTTIGSSLFMTGISFIVMIYARAF